MPRWRSIDGQAAIEDGFDERVSAALAGRGHLLLPRSAGDDVFGALCVAGVDSSTGSLFTSADGRRESWAAVW